MSSWIRSSGGHYLPLIAVFALLGDENGNLIGDENGILIGTK